MDKLLRQYTEHLVIVRGLSEKSARSYRWHVRNFNQFLNSRGEEITSASRGDVEDWLKAEWSRGIKTSSRAAGLSAVKGFYEFLVRENILSYSPAAAVPAPKIPQGSPQKFGTEELALIFAGPDVETIPGIRDLAMLKLMYGAGPRVSEITGLDMSSLLFTGKTVTVLLHGKGAKDRSVKLLADPAAALRVWFDIRISQEAGPADPFFITLTSNEARAVPRMSAEAVNAVLKKYAASVGIADEAVFVHKMRSTFATDLYDATKDILLVAAKMGHSDVKTTQRYIAISETALREGVIPNNRWKELRGGPSGIAKG